MPVALFRPARLRAGAVRRLLATLQTNKTLMVSFIGPVAEDRSFRSSRHNRFGSIKELRRLFNFLKAVTYGAKTKPHGSLTNKVWNESGS